MESTKSPGARFRELLKGEPFLAGDCYSALSARIVEHVGFPAAYMGGHSTGMMHYAIPDYGVITPTEMIEQAGRVAEVIDIPLVVDADEAGDSVDNVFRTIRRFESVGLAGVHIEDETHPKHSTFDGPLLSITEMQQRISAATKGRRSDDFVIIVRCNEFQSGNPKGLGYLPSGGGTGSLEEVIKRGKAFQEAGADAFIPVFATEEDLKAIAEEVTIPLGDYQGLTPGLQFSLFTGYGTASAANAHYEIASYVFEHGVLPKDRVKGIPLKEILLNIGEYDDVINTWAQETGRPTRALGAR
jgi:2-methylisocitrate lyase-like PEP mutase family enzyme